MTDPLREHLKSLIREVLAEQAAPMTPALYRELKGMSRKQLAHAACIGVTTISNLESGKTSIEDHRVATSAKRIAYILGVSESDYLKACK